MVIVAAVDRSERSKSVIEQAGVLARAFGELVQVVHVLSTSDFVDLGRTMADEGDQVDMDEVREAAEEIAAEAGSNLDVPYESVGLIGNPGRKIVEHAEEEDTRYIVISGRKKSPAGKVLFGSVAQSVLLNASCPVVSTIGQSPE